ncbi:DUF983 domain-containing protein [Consotaella salsifontis]|uniref:Uncharacterized conserved protein, DUF983 family n=1 Tax=Consotaella salsifontis TaxID=1365950 RepID=A0A1T4LNQ5_9HYPH|nr:DUF983 domain-containing protein [Consotaella salsifontis]SJZ56291.1 Uncharacterized conserved protein, DUF983 family [Consotaella salsifontis]
MTDFIEQTIVGTGSEETRPLGPALLKGLKCRCPRCGEGALFSSYLKTVDHCAACGEAIHHHRADDLPPYITVFIVGHLIVGLFMAADDLFAWSMGVHLAVWTTLTLLLCLAMLPPVKGATVGLQWALRMHGFGGTEPAPEDELA